jgi:proteasome lid subunit RPN8/RPN11
MILLLVLYVADALGKAYACEKGQVALVQNVRYHAGTQSKDNIATADSVSSTGLLNCPFGTYCSSSYDHSKPAGTVNGIPFLGSCRSYFFNYGSKKAVAYIVENKRLVASKLKEQQTANIERLPALGKENAAGGASFQPIHEQQEPVIIGASSVATKVSANQTDKTNRKAKKDTKKSGAIGKNRYPTSKIVRYTALPPAPLEATPKVEKFRSVTLPQQLVKKFANTAYSNTLRRKETCGILAGKEIAGKLVISTIIIPPQIGNKCSCTMDNDVTALLDYQLQKELMQIGWIHTHIGVKPFMSSADLHTQHRFSLQIMESIAIVVSPRKGDFAVGLYRLTESGASVLAECEDQRFFHPHDESRGPLYGDLLENDGIEILSARVTVKDLRL